MEETLGLFDSPTYSETSEDYLAWRNEMMNVEVNA